MPDDIPLHIQKLAVSRAHDVLEEIYPARIEQKKITAQKAEAHLNALLVALATLDKLDTGPYRPTK